MAKKKKTSLGIGGSYKSRASVMFLLRGARGMLANTLARYDAFLSANEIVAVRDAIGSLERLIEASSTTYEVTMKPLFIQKANEAKSQSPASDGSQGQGTTVSENPQPSDSPGQEGPQG